uniref:POTRA domain-containing protein n=1 Tax=Wildemania schizophylla TaxID=1134705 RepID=A0A126G1F6_WILSC|nr:hypothetical protein [Wildemania schizophylla]AKS28377.1 hypothetical protein [Wildemania schizophylla]
MRCMATFLKLSEQDFDPVTSSNAMKTSGYFSLLQLNNRQTSRKEVASLVVLPNHILKKIYIYNCYKKLVPRDLLIKQFQKQVGYPKSFTNLNRAVSRIMKWYSDRGYQWALIDIQYVLDKSSIIININEGLINTITTKYYTSSFEKLSNLVFTKHIEQYLGVQAGSPVNIAVVQRKINYLKNSNLIGNITYSIERSKEDYRSVDIVLQVQELRDKELRIFGAKSSSFYNIITVINQFVRLDNNLAQWLVKSEPNSSLTTWHLNPKLSYVYNNHQDLIKLLNCLLSHYNNSSKRKYNLTPLLAWTKKKTLGCRLYLRNINQSSSFCAVNIKSIKNTLNAKAIYLDPSLLINPNSSIRIIIQVFQEKYATKDSNSSIYLRKQDASQYIFESLLAHNYTSYFSLCETILLSKTSLVRSFFQSHDIAKLNNKTKEKILSNYRFLKQNSKNFYQSFLALLLTLNYQSLDSIDWPTKGYLTEIKSWYFIPCQTSNFLSRYSLYNCNNLFSHQVTFKHLSYIGLPVRMKNQMYHILVSTIKIQSNFCKDTVSSLKRNYAQRTKLYELIQNLCFKFRIEYHVPISTSCRMLLFYNYIDNFSQQFCPEVYSTPQSFLESRTGTNTLAKKVLYGFGIQIKLPIRQIPPLSIEYTMNSHRQFCFYLYISHQQ